MLSSMTCCRELHYQNEHGIITKYVIITNNYHDEYGFITTTFSQVMLQCTSVAMMTGTVLSSISPQCALRVCHLIILYIIIIISPQCALRVCHLRLTRFGLSAAASTQSQLNGGDDRCIDSSWRNVE